MDDFDNPPAFPIPGKAYHYDEGTFTDKPYTGMSLRDYFAGQALAGIMSSVELLAGLENTRKDGQTGNALIARHCYAVADAILKAREE